MFNNEKVATNLYSNDHKIPVFEGNTFIEDRNLIIIIIGCEDKIQIKLKDASDYAFNYTENIDLGDFEVIRENQSLDINYNEFKLNLIEMLQQFQKREMFLKCQLKNSKCTLIFYNKSKIKSIIYLTLELHLTDQKEVILEIMNEIQHLQEVNTRIKQQIVHANKVSAERDKEIKHLNLMKTSHEEYFKNNLKAIQNLVNNKAQQLQSDVCSKLLIFTKKINYLEKKVLTLKEENSLKSDSSDRLMKTMENLRLENLDNTKIIEGLKKENSYLNNLRFNLEKTIADLRKDLEDKNFDIGKFEKKMAELEHDLGQMSIIVTQKQNTIDELSKDLVQANGMLVNFNKHYDNKVKEVLELQEDLTIKEKNILDHQTRINQILRSFEDYRSNFNSDSFEILKKELSSANVKICSLEEDIRKLNKINKLLTQKINSDSGLLSRK